MTIEAARVGALTSERLKRDQPSWTAFSASLTEPSTGRAYQAGENLSLEGVTRGNRTWEDSLAEKVR